MEINKFDIEFSRDGAIYDSSQFAAALEGTANSTDIFIMSHGWNNNKDEATALYDALTNSIQSVIQLPSFGKLHNRRFSAIRVYWPSKRFEDAELIPGGGAASAGGFEDSEELIHILDRLKSASYVLGDTSIDPVRAEIIERAKAAVHDLDTAEGKIRFVSELRALVDVGSADPDDGSAEFFTEDPVSMFERLDGTVGAPVGPSASDGAVSLDAEGSAAGLQDMFSGVISAARRLANYTTYCDMKQRAGVVGRIGVANIAMFIRQKNSEVRLHFIGHSFGGRLVTAATSSLPENGQSITLSLLQAAFSHNGFARGFKENTDGAFRTVIRNKRVSGPIIITHTKNDRAVGIAYPLASRITRDAASSLGDENDPYGGMGRNGAQNTPERDPNINMLLSVDNPYYFKTGCVYNLKSDDFIKDHGDVSGEQVAYAILSAVTAC
jgi:hypothetical protein